MSKMMSKQVSVNLSKSIEATCLKCIEPPTHKIEKQSKLIDNLLSRVSVLEKDLEEQQQYFLSPVRVNVATFPMKVQFTNELESVSC
jgi:hypothetical protein